ncbi:MAG: hypothetical protein AAFQ60_01465 [Pseudomonadota bacterium]
MTHAPLDTKSGTQQIDGLVYAQPSLEGHVVPLGVDLFLPPSEARPAPLLVWLGPDILSNSATKTVGTKVLADFLTRHGVALAVPKVRVNATRADVPNTLIERLARIEGKRDKSVHADLSTLPAMAATQDLCALLTWADGKGKEVGLTGRTVLAGASTGAGLAFNAAVVAPHIGLRRPEPAGILSYSGTCAWPSLYAPGQLRVFALHNPSDRRMPIDPIREMAQNDPMFELIESIEQVHGSLGLWPQETAEDACTRILTRVKQWCAR